MKTVPIRLGEGGYDILIGPGRLAELPRLLRERAPAPAYAVVADSHVAEAYGNRLAAQLQDAKLQAVLFSFPAGEWNKTRDTWAELTDRMIAARVGRDGVVVALGGGVVGDVAGFVAATYQRGIPYVQVPTTLLAMIDSSIGGKTGVDTPAGKNLIGAFHQPTFVLADTELLATLPRPQLIAGMAEAIKHGVVADAQYFRFLVDSAKGILAKDMDLLTRVIVRSVEIKAAIVAEDERERGKRAVLNFGHTIGHAIETRAGYAMLHGEAIAIGMRYEAELAERLGVARSDLVREVRGALERFGLPMERPDSHPLEELLETVRVDKKARAGELRFALPRAVGEMARSSDGAWTTPVPEDTLRILLAG